MAAGRLQGWKLSVNTGAKGFRFRLKISNARGWFFQNKSKLLRVSVRANLHGALLRIKVAANKVLGKCGDQNLKWKNVNGFGEFRFRDMFLRIRGLWVDAKAKSNLRTNAHRQSKSQIASYGHFLKSIPFISKKIGDSEKMNEYSMREFCEVVWSTFVPYLPRSKLPGIVSAVLVLVLIELVRWGQMPSVLKDVSEGISGWVAMLLFMWSRVSQLNAIIRNPANLNGLSVITNLLTLIGNGMLIPHALSIWDPLWFIGSS